MFFFEKKNQKTFPHPAPAKVGKSFFASFFSKKEAFLLFLLAAAPASAATYDVGPGRAIPTPSAVPWTALRPGDEVVVRAGTYRDPVIIPSQGTAAAPIVVRADGAAVVESSFVLEGARHVVLRGFTVRRAQHSGFILRHGAAFVTVEGATVTASGLGIWIGDGAGGGHRLIGNQLSENRTHGIAIDNINAPEGQETLISGNRIWRNGYHGMEINGNRYIVERNTVWQNGIGLSGTSGIHTFARDARQGAGQFNIIRYNTVSGQEETSGQDGNGIQLDQWCDNNQVYFNVTFANDGAGIVLFDAANNTVANNTLFDNMRDKGGRHAYKADLVIASDYTKNVDHAFGNVIRNNLVYTLRKTNHAILLDRFAARNTREISNNALFHADPGGALYSWDGRTGRDIAAWNGLKTGRPDFDTDPMLRDTQLPRGDLAGWRGLVPKPGSWIARRGIPLPANFTQDHAGRALPGLPIGAYVPSAD